MRRFPLLLALLSSSALAAPPANMEKRPTADPTVDQVCVYDRGTSPQCRPWGQLKAGVFTVLPGALDQFVFATGLLCAPGNADANTMALNTAMAVGAAVGRPVILPPGVCPINPIVVPDNVVLQGQGQQATTLKLAPTSDTGTTIIGMGNFSVLRQLTLDGNKSAHTVGNWGIGGYRVQGARIEDVTVTNVLGFGDAFSDSARITHLRETVTNTQRPSTLTSTTGIGNGSGFWTGSYTQSSFYYDGGSQYIDCEAAFNDLDGIEYGSDNITIRGGNYHDNGQFTDRTSAEQSAGTHANLLGGALGAAGVYTAVDLTGGSPAAPKNTIIQGVRATGNSESGLDLTPGPGSIISHNTASLNGTNGFEFHDGGTLTNVTTQVASRFAATGNLSYDNANTTNATWIANNPNLEVRAGFAFYGRVAFMTFTGNQAFDDRSGAAQKQRWGAYGETRQYSPSFDSWTVMGNTLTPNLTGAVNFDGLAFSPLPAAFTNLAYSGPRGRATWTPTPALETPGSPPSTFVTTRARFTREANKSLTLDLVFQQTAIGTGSSGCIVAALPAAAPYGGRLSGSETIGGTALTGTIADGGTTVRICSSTGAYPPAVLNDYFVLTGTYEAP